MSDLTTALALTTHTKLQAWVGEIAALTQPDSIHWCDGSAEEYDALAQALIDAGTFERLSDAKRPNSYLALSDPADVARVEERTFICTATEEGAGPTNNWADPTEMRETLRGLFRGCMRGRTMYVIRFCMGPLDAEEPMLAIEITDSEYVVVSMKIMTRIGASVLPLFADRGDRFVKGLHSVGAPLGPDDRDVP